MSRPFTLGTTILIVVLATALISTDSTSDIQASSPSAIRFAILGDRTGSAVPGIYDQIVEEIQRLRPDFVMTVGDMIEGPSTDSAESADKWDEYRSIVGALSMPLYLTPGNNDIDSDFEEKMYRLRVGKPFYSFDHEGVHLVVLDNGRWPDYDEFIVSDEGAEQLAWLGRDLQEHREATHKLVFMHIPYWYDAVAEGEADTLHTLFVEYGIDAVFTGHYHAYFTGEYDGIRYTGLGSSGGHARMDPTGLLYHFGWVTIDGDGIHVAPIKMNSVLPWDQVTAADRKVFNPLIRRGITFAEPVRVATNHTVPPTVAAVILDNSLSKFALQDTLRWDIPAGWVVTPALLPVQVPPGEKRTFQFDVECRGMFAPPPEVEVDFTYAADRRVPVRSALGAVQQTICHKRMDKIELDGIVAESDWHDPVTGIFKSDAHTEATEAARFYFAYDQEFLYLAAVSAETDVAAIVGRIEEHDGAVYSEDCVGLFLSPGFASDTFYQVYINPRGTIYDARWSLTADRYLEGGDAWNGEYEAEARIGDDAWTVEARIPWKQFGVIAESGDELRINLRRKQKRTSASSHWQIPVKYDPAAFGILILE